MSKLVTGALNKIASWGKPVVLDKNYFIAQLKKICDGEDHSSTKDHLLTALVSKYTGREDEVVQWITEIALNKKEKVEYQYQAVLVTKFFSRNPEIISCLEKCAEDGNITFVREEAIRKLSVLRDERFLPLFAKYLNHKDYYVCAAAAKAIGEIGGKEARKILDARKADEGCLHKDCLSDALEIINGNILEEVLGEFDSGPITESEKEMKARRVQIIEKFTDMYGEEKTLEVLADIALNFDLERKDIEEAAKCLEEAPREKAFKALIKGVYDRS
ncbi:MAG: HEAT repeat domain-containing protein [Candidatus Melainabacteria bacterium]|nr:HEAT repeat domain-containing protein [Candidatus Melainabacteria bacterium]